MWSFVETNYPDGQEKLNAEKATIMAIENEYKNNTAICAMHSWSTQRS